MDQIMRFMDLAFKQMTDQFHGPGELQARCVVAEQEISVRRGGKHLIVGVERPYEVLVGGGLVLGYMTSGDIDDLFMHLESGKDADSFIRRSSAELFDEAEEFLRGRSV